MKNEDQNSMDQNVLDILRYEDRELTVPELVAIVQSKSKLDDIEAKRAIWRLIYYQQAYMSPEQLVGAKEDALASETEMRERVA
jgi:hypothetical protein